MCGKIQLGFFSGFVLCACCLSMLVLHEHMFEKRKKSSFDIDNRILYRRSLHSFTFRINSMQQKHISAAVEM